VSDILRRTISQSWFGMRLGRAGETGDGVLDSHVLKNAPSSQDDFGRQWVTAGGRQSAAGPIDRYSTPAEVQFEIITRG